MSNRPRKKKKHSAAKRYQRMFGNVRLWSWESEQDGEGARAASGEVKAGFIWKDLNHRQVVSILDKPNNWIITCRALCKAGDEVWVEEETRAARQVKVSDFEDIYQDLRKEVLNSVQTRHVVDLGWLINSFNDAEKVNDETEVLAHLGPATEYRQDLWRKWNQEDLPESMLISDPQS